MFEKNWSRYLIELLWVAIIVYGIISHLLKSKNIGMKLFLIIEIILVPNFFLDTLIYFYIFVFFISISGSQDFFACYIHIHGQSQDTPQILTDTHRYLQIPLDASQTLTSLFYFIYLMTHHTLHTFNIYKLTDKFRKI